MEPAGAPQWYPSANNHLLNSLSVPLILRWSAEREFVIGAKSVSEMFRSVISATLSRPNPNLVNDLFRPLVEQLSWWILPLVGVSLVVHAAAVARGRGGLDDHGRRLLRVSSTLVLILLVSLVLHVIAFQLFHLPLPKARTALWTVLLATLSGIMLSAITVRARWDAVSPPLNVIAWSSLAVLFLLSSRLTYFEEWRWNADVKRLYFALAYYNHACGIEDVPTSWFYVSSMNFYRVVSGHETFNEFSAPNPMPVDKSIYVLHNVFDRQLIEDRRLTIVFAAPSTDAVVAVRPEMAERLSRARHGCR